MNIKQQIKENLPKTGKVKQEIKQQNVMVFNKMFKKKK